MTDFDINRSLDGSRADRRRERTRSALLTAAETLLGERSSNAIAVDDIVRLADVAKGTLYNYFEDKDALLREAETGARDALEQAIATENRNVADAAERVMRALSAALAFARAHPRLARTLLRMSPDFADPSAPANVGVRRDIADGLASGRFDVASEEAGMVLVMSVLQGGMSRVVGHAGPEAAGRLACELGVALLTGLGLPVESARALANDQQTGD